MMITGRQALAARLLLQMDRNDVAAGIRVYKQKLSKFESRGGKMETREIYALRQFFELAGAEFVLGGVKIRDRISDKAAPPTPEQCRAARGLLVLPMEWLARYAGCSADLVFNLERGRIPFKSSADKLLTYLETEGILLLPGGARDLRPESRYTRPSQRALK
jgi:DNA-binding transcriptional regulator YiaG